MVERVLVDTDVLISYVRGRRNLPYGEPHISEITLYEFLRGTKSVSEAKELLEEGFIVIFHDNYIIQRAAEIWIDLRRRGELLDDRDLLIGATAIEKNLPLLTENRRHYERLRRYGLVLLD